MSEEQIKEALEQEELQDVVDEQEEQEEQSTEDDLSDLSPIEQEAWGIGWRPEDQFEGKPGNWKTALKYIAYGEFQNELHKFKNDAMRKDADHEASIIRLNKLHEAQQKNAIDSLKAQQRQAVEEADTAEFDRLQGQIDSHQTVEKTEQVPVKDPVIQAWEDKNSWINDPNDEKAMQAQAFWAVAAAKPGATAQSALDYVDAQLDKLYPPETLTNPRREMPTMTEQSARPSGRRRSKELTMDDLTNSEREEWKQFGSIMFPSEKDFLKAVADARKEK